MGYEYKGEDVLAFAQTIHTEKRQKGNELFFRQCPYCGGGKHGDDYTFSVNLENGTFKCFRAGCGKQGHFVELARDFGFALDFGPKKQYRRLPQRDIAVKPPAVSYLASRGIGESVAERYHITTQKDNDGVLVFPFYDEHGVLVFIKYRNTKFAGRGSKEWCEKDTKPVLFGMAQCEGTERLVITEGQMDSLTLTECGVKNAVSVPTGACGFTWLPNVWDWIMRFAEVVVFGDWENGKMTLLDELQKRLPMRVKAVREEDYLGEKDANAILMKYGREAVAEAVARADVPPVEHVKELADVRAVDIYELPHIKTNIREIDKVIGGLYMGQVVLLTGKRGEGKSTFLSQLVVEAIEQECPVFAYSGELADYHFKRWVDFQAAGPRHTEKRVDGFGNDAYTIPGDMQERINDWYRGLAYIYDNNVVAASAGEELPSLLETAEKVIRQYGVRLICIDNLMTALDDDLRDDLYRSQSRFVKALKQVAVQYDVVVVLVAHPRKSGGNSREKFENDDVAGSGDITNRVDIVLNYARGDGKESDGLLSVTKNRLTGKITGKGSEVRLFYSQSTKRITSLSSDGRVYGWERDREDYSLDTLPF